MLWENGWIYIYIIVWSHPFPGRDMTRLVARVLQFLCNHYAPHYMFTIRINIMCTCLIELVGLKTVTGWYWATTCCVSL